MHGNYGSETGVTGPVGEPDLGLDLGGEGGTVASRRQTGRRDMVSLRSGFSFSGRGEGAWMQAAWWLVEQGVDAPSDAEIEVTRVQSAT